MPDKIRYVFIKNKPGKRFSEPVVLEATPRVELGNRGFADLGLTTWLCRQIRHHKLVLSPNQHTKMATRMGLEPTISAVTGRHSKPTELPGRNTPFRDNIYYYTDRKNSCQRRSSGNIMWKISQYLNVSFNLRNRLAADSPAVMTATKR